MAFRDIFRRTQQLILRKQDDAILPTRVANHSTGVGPLMELAIEYKHL